MMEEMLGESRRLGRPRTRPPVRRITVEIDEQLLAHVERIAERDGLSLRQAVEGGLRLVLARLLSENTVMVFTEERG